MTNENYNIKLNKTELKTVLKGLGKLPFEDVYELIEKIVKQTAIDTQTQKKQKNEKLD